MNRLLLLGLLLITGCATSPPAPSLPPLPVYPPMSGAAMLDLLRQRSAEIQNLSSRCDLVLTRENGESVELDGAMALDPPDRLRIRAWKAGQAVFDLTLRPDGVWIELPEDAGAREKILPATVNTARMGQQLLEFAGGFFNHASLQSMADKTAIYRHDNVYCEVDRATLTPHRYWLVDDAGTTRFELDLSEYREFHGVLWPMHLRANEIGGNKIEIEFSSLDMNGGLAARAFDPPPRAEKRS